MDARRDSTWRKAGAPNADLEPTSHFPEVSRPPRGKPPSPSPERQLGRATFMLWEVQQMLLEQMGSGEWLTQKERDLLIVTALSSQNAVRQIRDRLETTEVC